MLKLSLVLWLMAALAAGEVYDGVVEVDDKYTIGVTLSNFYFDKGGYIDINVTEIETDETLVYNLLVVNYDTYNQIFSVCDPEIVSAALFHVQFDSAGVSAHVDIPEKDIYYTIIVFCNRTDDLEFRIRYQAMNPNGSHLSISDMGHPYVYSVFAVLWFGTLVYWLINWFRVKGIHRLHLALTVYIIVSCISLLFNALTWFELYKYGDVSDGLWYFSIVCSVIYDCTFFTILLLIASGWGIVDNKPPKKWFHIAIAIAIYLGSLIGSYFSNFAGIVSAVALFAILLMIWSRFGKTYDSLDYKLKTYQTIEDLIKKSPTGQVMTVENANADGTINENSKVSHISMEELEDVRSQVQMQAKQLHRFYKAVMVYIIGQILIMIVEMMSTIEWVNEMLYRILDFGIILYMQFIFRLHGEKKKNMYFLLETNAYSFDDDDEEEIERNPGTFESPTNVPSNIYPTVQPTAPPMPQ